MSHLSPVLTPHQSHTSPDQVVDPKKIKVFVLDEADVMIDQQGQQDQTIRIQRFAVHNGGLSVQ